MKMGRVRTHGERHIKCDGLVSLTLFGEMT